MGVRMLVALLAVLLLGCGGALYSRESSRSHDAYTAASLESFRRAQADGLLSKADVLATLGPPIRVIGQEDGEIFVYRRVVTDTNAINLNPGVVSGLAPAPAIPLYLRSRTSGRDDTLMIFFDAHGQVRGESARHEVGDEVPEASE
jgi:hypothetical protein